MWVKRFCMCHLFMSLWFENVEGGGGGVESAYTWCLRGRIERENVKGVYWGNDAGVGDDVRSFCKPFGEFLDEIVACPSDFFYHVFRVRDFSALFKPIMRGLET